MSVSGIINSTIKNVEHYYSDLLENPVLAVINQTSALARPFSPPKIVAASVVTPTFFDEAGSIIKNTLIASNSGDQAADVLFPIAFSAGLSVLTMVLPMFVPQAGVARVLFTLTNTFVLATPRLGMVLSMAAGFGLKKAINALAYYDEVAAQGDHTWKEACDPVIDGTSEIVMGLGFAIAGGYLGRLFGGKAIGNGLGFFALKEGVRFVQDPSAYDFFSQQTAINLGLSMMYMGINPLVDKGITSLLSANSLNWMTYFQRFLVSGVASNSLASLASYEVEGLLNGKKGDFGDYWARDMKASGVYSAFRPFFGSLRMHSPNYANKPGPQSITIDGPSTNSQKPDYQYILETVNHETILRRTVSGKVVTDVQWVLNAQLEEMRGASVDTIHGAITEMRVWSPYEEKFLRVERVPSLGAGEIDSFVSGVNPALLAQAGGHAAVKNILSGQADITRVSQYQIKLCFDSFRQSLGDLDAVAIYGSGLRSPDKDVLKSIDDIKNITGDELTDFIGITAKVPDVLWKMGQPYCQEVVSDPSKLVKYDKVVPRAWAQFKALGNVAYLYLMPDPLSAYSFKVAETAHEAQGRAKIGVADAAYMDRPGGKSWLGVSDRLSKLDVAQMDTSGTLEAGRSLVWVNPNRKPQVLGHLKSYSDNIYDAYLDEALGSQVRPGQVISLKQLMEHYVCISYEHEKIRSLSELGPDKRAKLVQSNARTFVPHLTAALNRKLAKSEITISVDGQPVSQLTQDHLMKQAGSVQVGYNNSWSHLTTMKRKQYEFNGYVVASYARWWTRNNAIPSSAGSITRLSRKMLKTPNEVARALLKNAVIPVLSGFATIGDGIQLTRLLPREHDTLEDSFPMRRVEGLYSDA